MKALEAIALETHEDNLDGLHFSPSEWRRTANMKTQLYKVKNVTAKQLILQAPTGGLRVVGIDGTTAQRTPTGYLVSTPVTAYAISSEDYWRLNCLLKAAS